MGSPTPDSDDRRVQRTRRALRAAQISLILERGWDGFSVQDLCNRADVGRSTFYTHFADKEDLLVGGLDDLRQALRQQLAARPATPDRALRFARGLIEHAHEQQQLFRAIIGKRSGQVVQRRFREMVLALVEEDLGPVGRTGPRQSATIHFLAGGLLELLTWWLESRSPIEPEAVEALLEAMAAPVVEGLRRA